MPSSILNQLPTNYAFQTIDVTDNTILVDDPNVEQIGSTGVQYLEASSASPTGTWIVNGSVTNAGTVVASLFYNSFLTAESEASTHLSAMSVNVAFAKAATSLASDIKSATGNSFTRANLVTMAGPYVSDLGITADAFVTLVLPNVTASETYSLTELKALATTVDQYSNNKLTDNSILQSKYNVATSNRTMSLEALSHLLKGWTTFLQSLEREI